MTADPGTKAVVCHEYCDCGCEDCGHEIHAGRTVIRTFAHPHGDDPREFAQRLVHDELGPGAELDWAGSDVQTGGCPNS